MEAASISQLRDALRFKDFQITDLRDQITNLQHQLTLIERENRHEDMLTSRAMDLETQLRAQKEQYDQLERAKNTIARDYYQILGQLKEARQLASLGEMAVADAQRSNARADDAEARTREAREELASMERAKQAVEEQCQKTRAELGRTQRRVSDLETQIQTLQTALSEARQTANSNGEVLSKQGADLIATKRDLENEKSEHLQTQQKLQAALQSAQQNETLYKEALEKCRLSGEENAVLRDESKLSAKKSETIADLEMKLSEATEKVRLSEVALQAAKARESSITDDYRRLLAKILRVAGAMGTEIADTIDPTHENCMNAMEELHTAAMQIQYERRVAVTAAEATESRLQIVEQQLRTAEGEKRNLLEKNSELGSHAAEAIERAAAADQARTIAEDRYDIAQSQLDKAMATISQAAEALSCEPETINESITAIIEQRDKAREEAQQSKCRAEETEEKYTELSKDVRLVRKDTNELKKITVRLLRLYGGALQQIGDLETLYRFSSRLARSFIDMWPVIRGLDNSSRAVTDQSGRAACDQRHRSEAAVRKFRGAVRFILAAQRWYTLARRRRQAATSAGFPLGAPLRARFDTASGFGVFGEPLHAITPLEESEAAGMTIDGLLHLEPGRLIRALTPRDIPGLTAILPIDAALERLHRADNALRELAVLAVNTARVTEDSLPSKIPGTPSAPRSGRECSPMQKAYHPDSFLSPRDLPLSQSDIELRSTNSFYDTGRIY